MTLFERVAGEQDRLVEQESQDMEAVRERLTASPPRPASRVSARGRALAAAALVVAAGVVAYLQLSPADDPSLATSPIGFTVGNDPGIVGKWATAATGQPVAIRFSDGSRWVLEPGARARVAQTRHRGADLTLESGRTHVSVVHREGSLWRVSAGPFEVIVTGTRFDVAWEPDRDHFSVTLHEGAVTLVGCGFGDGRPLHAGENAKASCGDGRFTVLKGERSQASRGEEPPPTEHPSGHGPSAAETSTELPMTPPPTARSVPTTREAPAVVAADPAWKKQLRGGDFAAVVRAAGDADFRAACEHATADQLSALGDAARYGGSTGRARTAYLSLRRRFAGTSRASMAAFRLGRMDFDQRRSYRDAAKWFATYLGERPSGGLAREALGRLVEARQRSGDSAGARTAARRYLELYPEGPHAAVARAALGGRDR